MAGSAKDPTKRVASLHCTFRVVGENDIEPIIIFANGNPNEEDPWDMPPGLANRQVTWDGKKGKEKEFYHPRAKVLFQENAYFDEKCATLYMEYVCPILDDHRDVWKANHPEFPYEPKVLLQQDNLAGQNTKPIKIISWTNDVFIWNTLINCTDVVAWLDQWVLWDLKCGVDARFWADFESTPEKTNYYSNPVIMGGITMAGSWKLGRKHEKSHENC